MQTIVHIFYLLSKYRFLYMAVSLVTLLVVGMVKGKAVSRPVALLLFFNLIYSVINIFTGSYLATALIYKAGTNGMAKITGSYETSTRYNNHNVLGYHVLIKTVKGTTVETSFEDDEFNIYPSANAVTYPGVNDVFTARYLPAYPEDFIIVSNDNSPWAMSLNCGGLIDRMNEARSKYWFDKKNPAFRKNYIDAIHNVMNNHCVADSTNALNNLKKDLEEANAGK